MGGRQAEMEDVCTALQYVDARAFLATVEGSRRVFIGRVWWTEVRRRRDRDQALRDRGVHFYDRHGMSSVRYGYAK